MSNFCRKGTDFSESPFTPDVCSTESQAEYFSPAAPYSQGACWSGPDFVPNAIRPLAPPEELSVFSLWADEVEPGPGVSPNLSVAPPQASAAEDRSGGSGGAPQNSRFHPLGTDVSPASTGAHGAPGVPPESLSDSNDVLALGASCNMAVGLPGRLSIGYGFTGGLGVGVSRGGGPLAYASVGHGPAIVPSVVSAGCSLDFNYSSDEDKFRGTGDSAGTGPMNLNFDDQGELHGFSYSMGPSIGRDVHVYRTNTWVMTQHDWETQPPTRKPQPEVNQRSDKPLSCAPGPSPDLFEPNMSVAPLMTAREPVEVPPITLPLAAPEPAAEPIVVSPQTESKTPVVCAPDLSESHMSVAPAIAAPEQVMQPIAVPPYTPLLDEEGEPVCQ